MIAFGAVPLFAGRKVLVAGDFTQNMSLVAADRELVPVTLVQSPFADSSLSWLPSSQEGITVPLK